MYAYSKTAPGERLTYRPADLSRYEGEPFCLRITLNELSLETCFFVYLDERFEGESLRKLLVTYFVDPGPEQEAEMSEWLGPWLRVDPALPKKLMLLRRLFRRAAEKSGSIAYFINHGPGRVDLGDTVRDHLGTSVFDDGSYDDKILDLVIEFHTDGGPPPELAQWASFAPADTALGGTGSKGGATTAGRRAVVGVLMFVGAIIFLPFLFLRGGCANRGGVNRNGGGGFFGGAL